MSFLTVAPEFVTQAASDLAGIGSALSSANAAAVAPTIGVIAPAADEVSLAITSLFGEHAREYQAISAQAATFHDEFVSLLHAGVGSYVSAEVANAGQALSSVVSGAAAAPAAPGLPPAYQALIADTQVSLQTIRNTFTGTTVPTVVGTIASYPQLITSSIQSGNLLPLLNIPVSLAQGVNTVTGALSNPVYLSGVSVVPPNVTVGIGLGLSETLILDALGAPVNAAVAGAHSASTIAAALQAGNSAAAMAALVNAPAYIADGLLNGQYTVPLNLALPGVSVTGQVPFGGLLAPVQPLYASVSVPGLPLIHSLTVTGPPTGGVVDGVVNYLPTFFADAFAL